MVKNAIVFDVDGVLANNLHRLHFIEGKKKDYDEFYKYTLDDTPYHDIIWLTELLFYAKCDIIQDNENVTLFICTARRRDCRKDTITWLKRHAGNLYHLVNSYGEIYMRDLKDYRTGAEVKSDMIDHIESQGYKIKLWLEDEPACISMLQKRGITVLDPRTHDKAEPFA